MNDDEQDQDEKNGAATAVVELKRYDEAFKRQAVEHWLRSGKNGTQIAQELGISYPSLKEWKRRYLSSARQPRAFHLASRWLWRESWPTVCLTLILGAVLIWHWGGGLSPDTLILRLLFVGLAALTMPHMLLTYWWHRLGQPVPGDVFGKIASPIRLRSVSRGI